MLHIGTPGSLQPHPPKDRVFDKVGSKAQQFFCARRERHAISGLLCALASYFVCMWDSGFWFGVCVLEFNKVFNGKQLFQMLFLVVTEGEVKPGKSALLQPAGKRVNFRP